MKTHLLKFSICCNRFSHGRLGTMLTVPVLGLPRLLGPRNWKSMPLSLSTRWLLSFEDVPFS